MKVRDAEQEAEEVRSWTCETCNTMIEDEDSKFCRSCREYWADVQSGMFEDAWDLEL